MKKGSRVDQKGWGPLAKGEPLEIIFPGKAPTCEDHILKAKQVAEDHGLTVVYEKNAVNVEKAPFHYYANSLEERVRHVISALEGPCRALWAFRGAYGCVEVIERLEALGYGPPKIPKLFIGYSDITHFHALAAAWGWISWHAPVMGVTSDTYATTGVRVNKLTKIEDIAKVLLGKTQEIFSTWDVLYAPPEKNQDVLLGSVVGGNATLVKETLGTKTALDTREKFVFLEDTAEDPKRLNRVLVSLLRGKCFEGAQAILCGHFPIQQKEEDREASLESLNLFIKDHLIPHGVGIPVLYSPFFGHGQENFLMPLGTKASLEIREGKGFLKVSAFEPFAQKEKAS